MPVNRTTSTVCSFNTINCDRRSSCTVTTVYDLQIFSLTFCVLFEVQIYVDKTMSCGRCAVSMYGKYLIAGTFCIFLPDNSNKSKCCSECCTMTAVQDRSEVSTQRLRALASSGAPESALHSRVSLQTPRQTVGCLPKPEHRYCRLCPRCLLFNHIT